MKFRNGFVSNSSTTSFCIYGAYVESKADCDRSKADFYQRLRELKLSIEHSQDGGFYIGRSWADIDGDETGNQFRKNIEDAIEKLTGNRLECETHD
jgi:hypothetical protein